MRGLLYSDIDGIGRSLALLALRLVVGLGFILHGWPKMQAPASWLPDSDIPGILLAAAAVAEFLGGIALIAGLLTPVVAAMLGVTMLVAIFHVHLPQGHPFVAPGKPNYELAAAYFACMVVFFFVGPGRLSADARLFRRKSAS